MSAAAQAAMWGGATGGNPVDRRRVTAYYDAIAARLEAQSAPPPPPALEEGLPADLLEELAGWAKTGVLAAKRFALNTGAGSGSVAGALVREGVPMIGLDLSHAMSRRSSRLHRQAPAAMFLCADGARMPFTDKMFGAIVDVSTFRHYPDAEAVTREWARVLAPKGCVVLADCVERDQDAQGFLTSLEQAMRPGVVNVCYKPHELAYFLEQAGLTIEKASYARVKKPFARLAGDECGPAGTDPAVLRSMIAGASPEARELYEISEEAMTWRYTALLARKR